MASPWCNSACLSRVNFLQSSGQIQRQVLLFLGSGGFFFFFKCEYYLLLIVSLGSINSLELVQH